MVGLGIETIHTFVHTAMAVTCEGAPTRFHLSIHPQNTEIQVNAVRTALAGAVEIRCIRETPIIPVTEISTFEPSAVGVGVRRPAKPRKVPLLNPPGEPRVAAVQAWCFGRRRTCYFWSMVGVRWGGVG